MNDDAADDALDADGPALVERLVRESGATTLLVTHDGGLAARMDMLWFVEDGRLVEAGPPAELLAGDGPTARHFARRTAAKSNPGDATVVAAAVGGR